MMNTRTVHYYNITYRCNSNCIFCAADHGLNDDNPEMTLAEFIHSLEERCVGPGDRVIINGGEPTVHTEFLQILAEIRKTGAYIDIYTNGKKLHDEAFCKQLLSYAPMLVRIPLFGSTAAAHDRLTGIQGNFEQTMAGIRNIIRFQTDEIEFELKLLMSKATVDEHPRIIRLMTETFPNGRYEFSLNPMLISRRVASNADIMFLPYSELFQLSKPLIDDCKRRGIPLKLDLIPLCVMERKYVQDYIGRSWSEIIEFYSDPDISRPADNHILCESCKECALLPFCNQFPGNYLDYYGESEIKPFVPQKP